MIFKKKYTDYFQMANDMNNAREKGNLKDVYTIYRHIVGQKLNKDDKTALRLIKAIQSGNEKKVKKILEENSVDVNYRIPTEMKFNTVEEFDKFGNRLIKTQPAIKFTTPVKFSKEMSVYREHIGEDNKIFVAISELLNEQNKDSEVEEPEDTTFPAF